MSIPQFDEIVYLSTEQEMEDKFSELGIMDVLPKCKPTPCSRDPEVNTLPPRNIVRHIRERGTLYFVNGSKLPIALYFNGIATMENRAEAFAGLFSGASSTG